MPGADRFRRRGRGVPADGDDGPVTGDASLSPIELIYDRNVASEKLKHGTKYEQLTALVFQVLDADATVEHDVKLRGDGKTTVHQIDVHITRGAQTRRVVIECRDKNEPNKIELDEARSFATVVRQLDADGVMVTTTGFTEGARTLAADEGMNLMTLKPFLPADADDRLMAIEVNLRAVMPVPDSVHITAPTAEGSDFGEGTYSVPLDAFIIGGSHAATLRDLLGSLMDAPLEGTVPEGSQTTVREFVPPVLLDVDGRRMAIGTIRVDYHVEVEEVVFRVDAGDRIAELVLRSVDGAIDRVIWDADLQRYIVDPTGLVVERLSED